MTLQELLNADVEDIGAMIRQGFAWWLEELASLLPSGWVRSRPSRAAWTAELGAPGAPIRWLREGRAVEIAPGGATPTRRADLALPPGAVLTRELTFPGLGARDIRRLVTLDLDRLTPFSADQVYIDTEVIARDPDSGRQRVLLGVLKRTTAAEALERAEDAGVAPGRVGVLAGAEAEGGDPLRFDFSRAIRAEGGDSGERRLAWWWGAVAALALVNIGAAVLRDSADVAALRQAVDSQRPTVTLAMRLRRTVQGEATRRAALLARRDAHEPLRMIDAATRALPAGQWVQRLEWNGATLRLAGYKRAEFDVLAAVRGSPELTNPRSLGAEPAAKPGLPQPFDLVAEPERRPAPLVRRAGARP